MAEPTPPRQLVAADQFFKERDNRKVAVALLRSQLDEAMNTQGKRLVSVILLAALLRDVCKNGDFFTPIRLPLWPFKHEPDSRCVPILRSWSPMASADAHARIRRSLALHGTRTVRPLARVDGSGGSMRCDAK